MSIESESSSSTEVQVESSRKRKSEKENLVNGRFPMVRQDGKETDILSDSNTSEPDETTENGSDMDTGQDGSDECDTDDLLGDTLNTAAPGQISGKKLLRFKKSRKFLTEDSTSTRRRKRFTRTQRKSFDYRDGSHSLKPFSGSRSVGGTPMTLRRNKSEADKR